MGPTIAHPAGPANRRAWLAVVSRQHDAPGRTDGAQVTQDARTALESERARARDRLAALERDFASSVEAARNANADDEHDPEGATLAFERQHVAAHIGRVVDRLREIDAALARLDEGGYGICRRCGQQIPAGRLAARPSATTCVACAKETY
jgi:DnaK suppressor protein